MREYDEPIRKIADYVLRHPNFSEEAYRTAHVCLEDSIGCGLRALQLRACTKLLGPLVPDTIVPKGSRVFGTPYVLDPVRAAFNMGTMIRWLDYNDTWLAAEWGHPSDNLGGILAVADYLSQQKKPFTVKDLLTRMIQAHEIQGVLALKNSLNRLGLDHVHFVKIATTAVVAAMLGLDKEGVEAALSQAWVDGAALRTYRHAPNTGSRKSWAAGDATSRGVELAWRVLHGEEGYPTVLTTPYWGFYDVLGRGKVVEWERELGCYVMENVLFKVRFPAEFHAQTAVECALKLHPQVKDRIDEIESIKIETQEAAVRIIDKKGPLRSPADRDHCMQYMVAVMLLFGSLTVEHYEDEFAKDPRIDILRAKMVVEESPRYSQDYMDPDKRFISNAIQIFFKDGTSTEKVEVEVPLGHKKRRQEALPLLKKKFIENSTGTLGKQRTEQLAALFNKPSALDNLSVLEFMNKLT